LKQTKTRRLANTVIIATIILLAHGQFSKALAEEEPSVIPKDVIPKEGILIHSQNYHDFFDYIATEMIPLVENHGMIIPAHPELAEGWDPKEEEPDQTFMQVGSDGSIAPRDTLSADTRIEVSTAQELLWKVESRRWQFPLSSLRYELFTFDNLSQSLELSGSIERVYPRRISGDLPEQLFRERVILSFPGTLDPLSQLSFRLFGSHEDFLWIRSPALRKNRRATSSNRADAIFKTSISLDDLFGFSSKIESLNALELKDQTLLIPFSQRGTNLLKKADSLCFSVEGDELQPSLFEEGMHWNFLSRAYPASPGWNPGRVTFVPREAKRVEMTSKDPFFPYGRQVLYVDNDTAVPALKFIYARSGELWKSIVSAFGLAKSTDGSIQKIFWDYSVVFDHISNRATVIDTFEHRYCDVPEDRAQEILRAFDPARLNQSDTSTIEILHQKQLDQEKPEASSEES